MRKIYKVALASSGERNVFDLYLPATILNDSRDVPLDSKTISYSQINISYIIKINALS